VFHNTTPDLQEDHSVQDQDQDRFFGLRPVSDHITGASAVVIHYEEALYQVYMHLYAPIGTLHISRTS